MSAGVAPSGDVYASAPQVQRLEELVWKQQQQIDALLKERNLFQSDFKTFLDAQLQRATSQRGAKAMEAMGTHTFLTTELTNAVQQIQQTIQGTIQESFPLKKLQMLEQRLMAKPTTSEDIGALVARISELEARPLFQPSDPAASNTNQSFASLEEFQQLQRHVTHLEDLLLKEIQKAHRLASTKSGELGAPLQRLQSQVDKLIQDVGHLKSVDGQAVAEALLKTSMRTFKEEIGQVLETKVSTNQLHRLTESVERMEGFSRDVQVTVLSVSNAQTKLEKDMRELFSEARWSVVSNTIRQEAKKALEEEQERIQNYAADQHRLAFEQLSKTDLIVKALDKEVRQQYGPEMLQRHIQTLQQILKQDHLTAKDELTSIVQERLVDMEKQIQGHRQHVLEATADIKHQLQASELSKRNAAFEQTLTKHEQTFASFDKRYSVLQQVLEQQASKAQTLLDTTTEQILGLDNSLTAMQTTIRTEQTQIRKQLQEWMTARIQALNEQVTRTESSLQSIQDEHTRMSHELQQSVNLWSEQQKKATSEGAELHTKLQESVKQWMSQQETYLYTRVVDMSSKVNTLQETVEEQAAQVKQLLAEETIQQFVGEIERRTKHIQEEWGQRRTQELQLKFGEYETQVKTYLETVDSNFDKRTTEYADIFGAMKREYTIKSTHAIQTMQDQIKGVATQCESEVKKSIATLASLTEDVLRLQEAYQTQTEHAIKAEQYEKFQQTVTKKLDTWATDTNAKLFRSIYQYQKDATQQLHELNTKHVELSALFSQTTLDTYTQRIEQTIRTDISAWQKTSSRQIESRLDHLKKEVQNLLQNGVVLEQQIEDRMSKSEAFLVQLEKTVLEKADAALVHQSVQHVQQLSKLEEKTKSTTALILDELRQEFTSGVSSLNDLKASAKELHTTLVQQINEAVTREKYNEYQNSLETKIREILTSTTESVNETKKSCIENVRKVVDQNEALRKSWEASLNEARVRSFVESIEKRLRVQQENWMIRRTQESQDTAESMRSLIEQYKQSTEYSVKEIGTVEQGLRKAVDAMMEKLQQSQQFREKEYGTWRDSTEDSWSKKQERIEEQVASWRKQILAFQTQKRQELSTQFSSEQEAFRRRFDELKAEYVQYTQKQNEQVQLTLTQTRKETERALQGFIINMVQAKLQDIDKALGRTTEKTNEVYTTIQKQVEDWLTQRGGDVTRRLNEMFTTIQHETRTTLSESIAKYGKTISAYESRLLTQMKEVSVKSGQPSLPIALLTIEKTAVQSVTKCFYTALIGVPGQQCDSLSTVPKLEGWDFICFTNQDIPDGKGWTCVQVEMTGTSAAVEAKRIKWLSHTYLADYDVVVWLDAYLAPQYQSAPIWTKWIQGMLDTKMLISHRPHPERNCIWKECDAVVKSRRDTEANVVKVRSMLTEVKMPQHWGLFDTNCMIRFHKSQTVQKVSEAIFKQVSTVSSRDQLAVSLVYYTMGFKEFQTQPLEAVLKRTGNHVRIAV